MMVLISQMTYLVLKYSGLVSLVLMYLVLVLALAQQCLIQILLSRIYLTQ